MKNLYIPSFFTWIFRIAPRQAALSAAAVLAVAAAAFGEEDETARYRDIIRYGTDTEITSLLQTLKANKTIHLDKELITVMKQTKSSAIRTAGINFFMEREDGVIQELVLSFLQGRDEVDTAVISAALDYTAHKGGEAAVPVLRDIIQTDDLRYQAQAIRALGKAARKSGADEKEKTAGFLLDFYHERAATEETRRIILEALGEGDLAFAADFLTAIIGNPEESGGLRVEAINSAGKLESANDNEALRDAVIGSLAAAEPFVRTAAVGALGSFPGKESDAAMLDALRDSFFRTRLAAEKAIGKRKLGEAIDFLAFRAKYDEAFSVREEAVRSLAAYETSAANSALESVYDEKKSGEKIRLMAAEALVKNDPGVYVKKLRADLDDAKKTKQKNLYNGLLKALSASKGDDAQNLVVTLLASNDMTDKSYAIDIIEGNNLTGFSSDLQKIADNPKDPLRVKAKNTLEKLGR
ncbi:MAG: HEAT repeat domain-containing protein [Spirochaetaceae bacterium]|jgi:HEAT repeat protein|nr:HEAT repeat domain-containing protein [Spirochaetaceae bacterium]